MIQIQTVDSPIGPLTAAERAGRVCLLHFGPDGPEIDRTFERWYPGELRSRQPLSTAAVLRRYFEGDLGVLDGVPVELNGTSFQKQVWQALRRIPAGTSISYAELARRIGSVTAVRAVGAANGANPVAVIVPCHRVIGSDGSLTGYGGGLERKQWLLQHEGLIRPKLF
ncbi:MAG TPA: methylated-DNA--[protein]-cysteine S-methyltransferase [Vicinamibacterales bacterium]|nr:methylated-DNA--[protein]-cysteine S-methyltransferase [Vicinamibacterales bacterium]